MEKVLRIFLLISFSVLAVVTATVLYRHLEAFAYDAYVPRYIEVPVIVHRCATPPVEAACVATSTTP